MLTPAARPSPATGSIDPSFVRELQETQLDGSQKAFADIVATSDIREIALNRERYLAHSPLVNHRIKTGSITNQKSSGRCWMFAGFNVLRPQLIREYDLKEFEFSENYLLFWDKLEKINMFFVEMINRAEDPLDDRRMEVVLGQPMRDGGWWTYFVDLVTKYGVVPKEVMPETHNSSATGRMNKLVGLKVQEMGLTLRNLARDGASESELHRRREDYLREVYRLLVIYLGTPAGEFVWRYETKSDSAKITTYPGTLTPQRFFEDVVAQDLSKYLALFNYPGKAYNQNYSLELSRNLYDRPDFTVLNVPIDTLKACALASILDSTAVWFACDVDQENFGADGIFALDIYNYELILDTTFRLPKKDLIELGLISPNHAMSFVGVDTIGTHAEKWLVENSWGSDRGDDGMWYMYDDWFDRYVFGVIVHERYVSADLRARSKEPPIVLPPWDPMYSLNNLR
jgi:bleomycin hydrolase